MSALANTTPLLRLVVSRDRVRLLTWVAGIVTLVVVTVVSTKGIYGTQAELDKVAALSRDNPAALAFNGPDQALDTIGGQIAFQLGAFGLTVIGLMSLLLVARVTRGEEDSGRLELVRSMPVGRHAPLAAGLAVVVGVNVVLGALVTVSLLASDLPTHGSILFGVSYLAFGLAFVGITAVAAQVAENPRVAAGSAGAVLGASYALRAVGDIGDGTLSWLSPMGWAQRARPYAGERWWPLVLCAGLGVALVGLAVRLAERRDFGAGMVAPRRGRAEAPASLSSPLGLALRLHRAAACWWALGVLAIAVTYGSLTDSIEDFLDSEAVKDVVAGFGGASLVDSYLATSLLVIALMAAGPALQLALRLRAEESALRADVLLATPTARRAWMGSHVLSALTAGALSLVLGGLGLGTAYAVTGGGWRQVPRLLVASLAYLPALGVLTGVAVALFGLAPRWTAGAWLALAGCFVIAMFGVLLDLPGWVLDLSPFQHTPAVPATAVRVTPLAVLTAVAAGLLTAGLRGFDARDLARV